MLCSTVPPPGRFDHSSLFTVAFTDTSRKCHGYLVWTGERSELLRSGPRTRSSRIHIQLLAALQGMGLSYGGLWANPPTDPYSGSKDKDCSDMSKRGASEDPRTNRSDPRVNREGPRTTTDSSAHNYELFNSSNVGVHCSSWNYRDCWHQTCSRVDTRSLV